MWVRVSQFFYLIWGGMLVIAAVQVAYANDSDPKEGSDIAVADAKVAFDTNQKIIRQSNGSISLENYDVVSITKAFQKNPNVEINFDVRFARNSTVLTADGRNMVDTLARVMFHIGKGYQFQITGYPDTAGSRDFKKRLSENRAHGMAILLRNNHGVPNAIKFLGSISTRFITENGTTSGKAVNASITISNKGLIE